jgi:hypothetical protein
VSFFDGTTSLGAVSLDNNGKATFSTSSLAVGDHPEITAQYPGQGAFLASKSAAIDQDVQKAFTHVTVSSSANPSVFGQSVTFQATVSPALPSTDPPTQPTGTIQFYDGSTLLGTQTLSQTNPPTATVTTTSLAVGDHPAVTASYEGDSNFLSSAGGPVDQVVNQAPTSTQVNSSPSPSTWGQAVTFTAVVSPAPPSTDPPTPPSGSVTFLVNGSPVATESLTPSSSSPIESQASYTTSGLLPGSQAVTAVYNGDSNFLASTSQAYVQQVTCTSNAASTSGSLKISGTGSTCVVGIHVGGAIIAGAGSKLFLSDSTVGGAVKAVNAALVGICSSTIGSTIDGTSAIVGTTGFVVVGDPGDDACGGNTIDGSLLLRDNTGDAEAWSNVITGSLILSGTSGIGPFPDDTQAELGSNLITGSLNCAGNGPPPVNDGQPNTAADYIGQCIGL